MNVRTITYNRHLRILDLLKEKGEVKVEFLADDLGVSAVTIRRDLDQLDQRGFLVRRHGGAIPLREKSGGVPEKGFIEKDSTYVLEKKRIAEKAAELISDSEILFMNSGSTVLFFLRALRNKKVRIITNNAAAIGCEKDSEVELMFLGGEYREQSKSFVGEIPLSIIKDINSSHTILGTNGLDLERGLTTSVFQESSINQAMVENTNGKVIVLADSSKLQRISNFLSIKLDKIDILVTDDKCPEDFRLALIERDIQVIIA